MSRLANLRDSPLTRTEIAATVLRQFDEHPKDPSIRDLALELRVTPTAIYHHYPSRAALIQSAVELVWNEASTALLAEIPDPLSADPVEVLVTAGMCTRRSWLTHHRVARHMAATPEANRFVDETLGVMANLFERLDLAGDDVAAAFHTYASFMIGAVLFAADRKSANEQLTQELGRAWNPRFTRSLQPESAPRPSSSHRHALEAVMSLSVEDPARDEALFEQGLRRVVQSFGASGTAGS